MSADQVFVVTYTAREGARTSVLAYSPSKANAMRFAEQAAVSTICRVAMRKISVEDAFYDPVLEDPAPLPEPLDRPYLRWDDAQPERSGTFDDDDRPVNEVAAIVRYGAGSVEVGRFAISTADLTVFDVLAEETEVDCIYKRIAQAETDSANTGVPPPPLRVEEIGDGEDGTTYVPPAAIGSLAPHPESSAQRQPARDADLHVRVDLGTEDDDDRRHYGAK